jgi:hypothetical protein
LSLLHLVIDETLGTLFVAHFYVYHYKVNIHENSQPFHVVETQTM